MTFSISLELSIFPMTTETRKSVGIMIRSEQKHDSQTSSCKYCRSQWCECIVLLNELVLVYVADEFLIEDAEEHWPCRC